MTTTIREPAEQDWPRIFPFYAAIVAEGGTYAFPEGQTQDEAYPWWMEHSPGRTVVASDDGIILGSAKMGPNRPGRGAHIATASFMVDPAHQGRGVGRALGEYVVEWARSSGFMGIQFNAVVAQTMRVAPPDIPSEPRADTCRCRAATDAARRGQPSTVGRGRTRCRKSPPAPHRGDR